MVGTIVSAVFLSVQKDVSQRRTWKNRFRSTIWHTYKTSWSSSCSFVYVFNGRTEGYRVMVSWRKTRIGLQRLNTLWRVVVYVIKCCWNMITSTDSSILTKGMATKHLWSDCTFNNTWPYMTVMWAGAFEPDPLCWHLNEPKVQVCIQHHVTTCGSHVCGP